MAKRSCLDESCNGRLDECKLQFPIEVKGGLTADDGIFVCDECLKVFFIKNYHSPICKRCKHPKSNWIHDPAKGRPYYIHPGRDKPFGLHEFEE